MPTCHSQTAQTNLLVPRKLSEYKTNELDWVETSSGPAKCQQRRLLYAMMGVGVRTRVALNVKRPPSTNPRSSARCGQLAVCQICWSTPDLEAAMLVPSFPHVVEYTLILPPRHLSFRTHRYVAVNQGNANVSLTRRRSYTYGRTVFTGLNKVWSWVFASFDEGHQYVNPVFLYMYSTYKWIGIPSRYNGEATDCCYLAMTEHSQPLVRLLYPV